MIKPKIKDGEYLFDSFEEAYKYVAEVCNRPTNYEQKHGIKVLGTKVVKGFDYDDIKIVERRTDDGTSAMYIFFKNSKKYDVWKFWCPSEAQINMLSRVIAYHRQLDEKNGKERWKN